MNDRVLSYCMGQRFLKIVSVRKPTDSQLRAMQEFHPYVFQIFAQLIEMHPGELPAFYMSSLFQPLLAPLFWERAGNVPALTRLMQVPNTGTRIILICITRFVSHTSCNRKQFAADLPTCRQHQLPHQSL